MIFKTVCYWVLTAVASKALQIKLADNESVIVYNHIQGYILDALMKAVFDRAH
ncbi:hypothetical protein [Lacticaseibacillus jixiensis]|uniref:hypothetical protein n=1 Tax=Lacticaseibacillus jixiensis TaxID=3231926 RepID=UPI0036F3690C